MFNLKGRGEPPVSIGRPPVHQARDIGSEFCIPGGSAARPRTLRGSLEQRNIAHRDCDRSIECGARRGRRQAVALRRPPCYEKRAGLGAAGCMALGSLCLP